MGDQLHQNKLYLLFLDYFSEILLKPSSNPNTNRGITFLFSSLFFNAHTNTILKGSTNHSSLALVYAIDNFEFRPKDTYTIKKLQAVFLSKCYSEKLNSAEQISLPKRSENILQTSLAEMYLSWAPLLFNANRCLLPFCRLDC